MQGTVRNAANSHSEFFQAHYEQCQAECLRRVPVPDLATGRWKRSRPEHAEGTAQPFKDPSDEEDHLPQTSKMQPTSAAAATAKTSTSCETLHGLEERLGSFHESARALANCLQKRDVLRKTDQSMIEAAKCMFHKIAWRRQRTTWIRVTPQSQEGLCTEIKQNKQRCSRTVILRVNPCPRSEESSEQICTSSVNRNAIAAIFSRLYRSKLSRMILRSSSSCRYLSITLQNGNSNSKCRRSLRQ